MTTLAGAAFTGVAATAMFAAPASAHFAGLSLTPGNCDTTAGKVPVVVSIDNDYSTDAKIYGLTSSVKLTKIVDAVPIPKRANNKNGKLEETVLVAPGTKVEVTLSVEWPKDGYKQTGITKTITVKADACPAQQEQAPAPAQPAPAKPVEVVPAANPATVPVAAASSSAPAAALPVTGSQTGLYAGGAAVLVAAGAGLFMVARRRRVTFEA